MFVLFEQVQQSFGFFFNIKVQYCLKCHPWEFKGLLKVYLVTFFISLVLSELLEFVEYKKTEPTRFVCVETMEKVIKTFQCILGR